MGEPSLIPTFAWRVPTHFFVETVIPPFSASVKLALFPSCFQRDLPRNVKLSRCLIGLVGKMIVFWSSDCALIHNLSMYSRFLRQEITQDYFTVRRKTLVVERPKVVVIRVLSSVITNISSAVGFVFVRVIDGVNHVIGIT